MFLFLNFNSFCGFFFVNWVYLFNFSTISFFLSTKCVDLTARVLIDYFYINNFFILWTNLWYLLLYFIILNIFLTTIKTKIFKPSSLFILMLCIFNFLILYTEISNSMFFTIELSLFPLHENVLLNNAINKVHPLLLHSSAYIFLMSLNVRTSFVWQYQNNILYYFCKRLRLVFYVLLFTLYLGSWWAIQEGSWGGWWNWDISEIFGLIFFFRVIVCYHILNLLAYMPNVIYYFNNALFFFAVFYCSMQINFSLVSHNFGFRSLKSFNPELFFIWLSLALIILMNKNLSLLKCTFNFFKKNFSPQFILQNFSLFIFMLLVFNTSFALIQNFLWNSTGLKFFIFRFEYTNYVLVLSTLCISLVTTFNVYSISLFMYFKNFLFIIFFFF